MSIYYLLLIWALVGILAALLALVARLKPATRTRYSWLWFLLYGLCSALPGGLSGFWLLGRLFSGATAAWVAIVALCLPWLFSQLRARRVHSAKSGGLPI
ncbi:MAG TPA: hypothetical protein VGF67_24735 [Ktedonobacteraceae bacterium]|jgi:uncharacterized membrane protein